MSRYKKDWKKIRSANSSTRSHHSQIKDIINAVDFNYFLDCGPGLLGSESWSVRDLLPDCKIIGFEPQNERFELLSNEFPGELYKKAVADKNGFLEGFMGMEEGKSDFWLYGNDILVDKGLYNKEYVECVTVDSMLADESDVNVFIWADIEGSELSMLKGAMESIEKGLICGLNLELRDKQEEFSKGCLRKEVFDFLYDNGFKSLSGNIINGTHKDFLFTRV